MPCCPVTSGAALGTPGAPLWGQLWGFRPAPPVCTGGAGLGEMLKAASSGSPRFMSGPLAFKNRSASQAWGKGRLASVATAFREPALLAGGDGKAFLALFRMHPGFARTFLGGKGRHAARFRLPHEEMLSWRAYGRR